MPPAAARFAVRAFYFMATIFTRCSSPIARSTCSARCEPAKETSRWFAFTASPLRRLASGFGRRRRVDGVRGARRSAQEIGCGGTARVRWPRGMRSRDAVALSPCRRDSLGSELLSVADGHRNAEVAARATTAPVGNASGSIADLTLAVGRPRGKGLTTSRMQSANLTRVVRGPDTCDRVTARNGPLTSRMRFATSRDWFSNLTLAVGQPH